MDLTIGSQVSQGAKILLQYPVRICTPSRRKSICGPMRTLHPFPLAGPRNWPSEHHVEEILETCEATSLAHNLHLVIDTGKTKGSDSDVFYGCAIRLYHTQANKRTLGDTCRKAYEPMSPRWARNATKLDNQHPPTTFSGTLGSPWSHRQTPILLHPCVQ